MSPELLITIAATSIIILLLIFVFAIVLKDTSEADLIASKFGKCLGCKHCVLTKQKIDVNFIDVHILKCYMTGRLHPLPEELTCSQFYMNEMKKFRRI